MPLKAKALRSRMRLFRANRDRRRTHPQSPGRFCYSTYAVERRIEKRAPPDTTHPLQERCSCATHTSHTRRQPVGLLMSVNNSQRSDRWSGALTRGRARICRPPTPLEKHETPAPTVEVPSRRARSAYTAFELKGRAIVARTPRRMRRSPQAVARPPRSSRDSQDTPRVLACTILMTHCGLN